MKKQFLSVTYLILLASCLTACGSKAYEVHTDKQLSYINDSDYKSINSYACGASNTGDPKEMPLSFKANADNQVIVISKNEDLSSPVIIDNITSTHKMYNVYNLESGEYYYYGVGKADGSHYTAKGNINIKDTYPRVIYAEGVKNIRDLASKDNIKQGLLYRGGEFDYYQSRMRSTITNNGIKRLTNHLGIKTEIDLRDNDAAKGTSSALGSSVNFIHIPMYFKGTDGENVLTTVNETYNNPEAIKEVLNTLADSNNYPIYFHCAKGKDRTGIISFIVKAILGDDFDTIMKDYCWSNFAYELSVDYQDVLDTYYQTFNAVSGATLKDKVYTYCSSTLGVETSKLNSIISILSK